MAKRRAIIRKLPAVETLGGTTVICSDKTGTLTENRMTVQSIHAGGEFFEVTGNGYDPSGKILWNGAAFDLAKHPALRECLVAGVLCNESQLVRGDNGAWTAEGDPTEAALLASGAKAGIFFKEIHIGSPRVGMIPFESAHMFRATLHRGPAGGVVYKVGAVERLLERCADTLDRNGRQVPLNADRVRETVETMASQGLRVLAMARRHVEVLGRLGDYVTGTGYRVIPVLGLLPDGVELDDLDLVDGVGGIHGFFSMALGKPQSRSAVSMRK
jgi:Ca2+-transporting ATPase